MYLRHLQDRGANRRRACILPNHSKRILFWIIRGTRCMWDKGEYIDQIWKQKYCPGKIPTLIFQFYSYTTCICICICITQCVSHILKPILIDNGQWQVLEEKKNPGKRFCFHKDRYLAAQSLEVKTNCSFGEPTGINNSHFCQIWKISKNKKNTKSKHKYSLLRNTLFGRCYQVLWNVNIWKQENPAVMFQKGHHMNAHIRITTKIGNTSIADFLLPI